MRKSSQHFDSPLIASAGVATRAGSRSGRSGVGAEDAARRDTAPLVAATALLATAFFFGGTAAFYPLGEFVMGVAGVVALLVYALSARERPAPLLVAGLAVILLLPIVQLVPLPPALWQALPGSALALANRSAVGAASLWWPASVDPEATMRCAVATLAPVAMFLLTLCLSEVSRRRLVLVLICLALASFALGLVQVATRDPSAYFFVNDHFGLPLGLFANRNHQALFLAVGAVAAAGFARYPAPRAAPLGRVAAIAAALLLAGGVVATGSRAGAALLVLSAVLAAAIAGRGRWTAGAALMGFAALGLVAVVALQTDAGSRLAGRLTGTDEHARADNWGSAIAALRMHMPLGTGMGTFVPVNAAVEPLSAVSSHYANHAHNDYLELAIEAGLPGLAIALLAWVAYGFAVSRLLRVRRPPAAIDAVAALGVGAMLLHAIVDYPLRVPMLSLEFAIFAALLASAGTNTANPSK
ncbi:O-antigen ligase family protein [Sphingomonas hengshuiensis]|uniref:O-antigen ligase-related domain-containing protein n=1 Tax=Sphingomonas hengshuiensis TaxID=1609977 RepID=A0A7U4JBS6_9SPHN|nr:O-antigen ligase family protein [Sphingomonas hengshuiensis]AJP73907.1 hypothetical protein TS85_22060 [Sphingomonas hengshuiensis]